MGLVAPHGSETKENWQRRALHTFPVHKAEPFLTAGAPGRCLFNQGFFPFTAMVASLSGIAVPEPTSKVITPCSSQPWDCERRWPPLCILAVLQFRPLTEMHPPALPTWLVPSILAAAHLRLPVWPSAPLSNSPCKWRRDPF